MKQKLTVGILFGGRTVEHEVSVKSAKNIYDAIDKDKYNVIRIGITKSGKWILEPEEADSGIVEGGTELAILPGIDSKIIVVDTMEKLEKPDVIFPVLHGTYGEDGTMQGLLKLMDIPFVGPGVLGSAVGMDKEIMKRLLKEKGILSAKYLVFNKYLDAEKNPDFNEVENKLGMPVFIKPASLGSSVGITKASTMEEFDKGIAEAFQFDNKVIVEENITGREIECAVLGNEKPVSAVPGEVRSKQGFYSYKAKYIDDDGADLMIPAELDIEMAERIKMFAVETYKTLYCEGLTRVDMFLTQNNELLINEVNTLPGFTKISMYPKLWQESGISYSGLIDRLLELALDRYNKDKQLKTSI